MSIVRIFRKLLHEDHHQFVPTSHNSVTILLPSASQAMVVDDGAHTESCDRIITDHMKVLLSPPSVQDGQVCVCHGMHPTELSKYVTSYCALSR